MSEPLVAVLGRGVVDSAGPVVHADDLGLTRGDGCFDATRLVVTPDGAAAIDHLDAHLERFARSAAALDIECDLHAWRELIDQALAGWSVPGEAVLRIMLTRGRESSPGVPVTGLVTITPLTAHTIAARDGIAVATLPRGHPADAFADVPWMLGGVKTLSYAVNIAAGREAARRNVDDVLFVSSDGYVLEAPRSTFIWRSGERLTTTTHEGTGVLASISQAAIFRGAAADGIEVGYGLLAVADVATLDGAWLVSSGRLVAPVLRIDDIVIAADDRWTADVRRWFGA